ncbi:hypothetical protein JHK87_008061 [Glycine soja]|nr:hypothetical protein JHK87_008061 [Glycine soja]
MLTISFLCGLNKSDKIMYKFFNKMFLSPQNIIFLLPRKVSDWSTQSTCS